MTVSARAHRSGPNAVSPRPAARRRTATDPPAASGPVASAPASSASPHPDGTWLSLTELGRLYGISAVLCGRQLIAAGLRQSSGAPSRKALHQSLALLPHPRAHHRSTLWHREGCGRILQQQGLQPQARHRLVQLWADLLEALLLDSGSISTSADEMAGEVPRELVGSVNQELEQRGSGFRVRERRRPQPSRRASACLLARSSMSRS